MIGDLANYAGREQAYIKHFLLSEYLEVFAHKIANAYPEIAYVDGFSGPWQSAGENFEDTSFGIALAALTRAKATWKGLGRDVRMTAYLVEKSPVAYRELQAVIARFPDVEIKTYPGAFADLAPRILADIPTRAFAFLFLDPKGWRINIDQIAGLLNRQNTEVVFNFMFDFINRAASAPSPALAASLDELIRDSDWRTKLATAAPQGVSDGDYRKSVLVEAFSATLSRTGRYPFVTETTVLRPLADRPLYCLIHATRNRMGLEVFRDCQVKAMHEQEAVRGMTKMQAAQTTSGQTEMFGSLAGLAPNQALALLEGEERHARQFLLDLTPKAPSAVAYGSIWPQVLSRHIIRRTRLNTIAAEMRKSGTLAFLDWGGPKKRVPDEDYRMQRP